MTVVDKTSIVWVSIQQVHKVWHEGFVHQIWHHRDDAPVVIHCQRCSCCLPHTIHKLNTTQSRLIILSHLVAAKVPKTTQQNKTLFSLYFLLLTASCLPIRLFCNSLPRNGMAGLFFFCWFVCFFNVGNLASSTGQNFHCIWTSALPTVNPWSHQSDTSAMWGNAQPLVTFHGQKAPCQQH